MVLIGMALFESIVYWLINPTIRGTYTPVERWLEDLTMRA